MANLRSFEPNEFLQIARRLARENSQASSRTAVGRIYYALFLTARESLLDRVGASFTNSGQDHGSVYRALRSQNRAIARRFDQLRRLRGLCDYDLTVRITKVDVERALSSFEAVSREL